MRRFLPTLLAALIVAAGCGGGGDDGLSVSGSAPLPTTTPTTTTTTVVTTTTLPLAVTEVPDVSNLALAWDQPVEVNEVTGEIDVGSFNRYLIGEPTAENPTCRAPHAMVPAGSLDGLPEEAAEAQVEAALEEAPAKAVALFLGIQPGDQSAQMLVGTGGGPEATRVVVIQMLEDDSVRALRSEFVVQLQACASFVQAEAETSEAGAGAGGEASDAAGGPSETQEEDDGAVVEEVTETPPDQLIPIIASGERTWQCQPGRGHQDFTTGPCV